MRRGSTGPGSGCGCRSGCARRAVSAWRSGGLWRGRARRSRRWRGGSRRMTRGHGRVPRSSGGRVLLAEERLDGGEALVNQALGLRRDLVEEVGLLLLPGAGRLAVDEDHRAPVAAEVVALLDHVGVCEALAA